MTSDHYLTFRRIRDRYGKNLWDSGWIPYYMYYYKKSRDSIQDIIISCINIIKILDMICDDII